MNLEKDRKKMGKRVELKKKILKKLLMNKLSKKPEDYKSIKSKLLGDSDYKNSDIHEQYYNNDRLQKVLKEKDKEVETRVNQQLSALDEKMSQKFTPVERVVSLEDGLSEISKQYASKKDISVVDKRISSLITNIPKIQNTINLVDSLRKQDLNTIRSELDSKLDKKNVETVEVVAGKNIDVIKKVARNKTTYKISTDRIEQKIIGIGSGIGALRDELNRAGYVKKAGDTMTGDLNFTGKGISTADYVKFNSVYSSPGTEPVGSVYWNTVDGTLNVMLYNGSIVQMGQKLHLYGKASGNIANGELCQFAGAQGDHILIKKAVASEIIANPHYVVGVATHSIANGDCGYVTWFGKVNDIYTKTPANNDDADWLVGDILYFDNTTGQLTKTAPVAPERRITVAAVIKEQTGSSETGKIIVRPTLGTKMSEVEDVNGYAHNTNGQVLVYNNDTSTWNAEHIIPDSSHYTGWDASRDTVALSFSNANRTVTITGNISVYINGIKYTKTNDSLQITDVTGMHYLYYTNVGGTLTLTESVNSFPGFDKCLTVFVYWNAAIGKGLLQDEMHWFGRDQWWHEWAHEGIKTLFANGLAGTYTTSTMNIEAGEFYDEDREHISTTQTTCNVLYKNGLANWEWDDAQAKVAKVTSNKLQYNNGNSLADVPSGSYVAYWIYATSNPNQPIMSIIGQRVDANITDARNNNSPDTLSFGNLPIAEVRLLDRVLYRQTGTSAWAYVETLNLRTASPALNGSYTATAHGALSGLLWATSNHSGTVSTLAGFDSAGSATYYTEANYMLVDGTRPITGDLTVQGDLTVNGDQIIQNVKKVLVEDNLQIINNGETGAGVTMGYAGIAVDRGSLNDYSFFFREDDDLFRVGETIYERDTAQVGGGSTTIKLAATTDHASANFYDGKKIFLVAGTSAGDVRTVAVGGWNNTTKILTVTSAFTATPDNTTEYEILITDNTQAVATREDSPDSGGVPYWNATDSRFDTNANFLYDSAAYQLKVYDPTYTSDQILLRLGNNETWDTAETGRKYSIRMGRFAYDGTRTIDFGYVADTSFGQNPGFFIASGATEIFHLTSAASCNIGSEDSVAALLRLYGAGTGTAEGGEMRLYTSADYDSVLDFYFFDAYQDDLRIGAGASVFATLKDTGRLGINVTAPATMFDVYSSGTAVTQPTNVLKASMTWSPSGAASTQYPTVTQSIMYYDSTSDHSTGYAICNYLYGYNIKAGVTNWVLQDMGLDNQGAGTIVSVRHLSSRGPVNGGGGTITNFYHAVFADVTAANVTNAYGINSTMNLASGKTRYNIYAAGTAYNYLGGNTGIFTTAPASYLAANAQGLVIAGTGGRKDAAQDGTERIPTLKIVDTVTDYGSNTATVAEIRSGIEFYTSETSSPGAGISDAIYVVNENTYNTDLGMAFYTQASTGRAERLRIRGGGNIGVGIAIPTAKFHIYENSTTATSAAGFRIENDGTGDARMGFALTGGAEYSFGIDNSSSDQLVLSASSALGTTDVMKITTAGALYLYSSGDITCNAKVLFNAYAEFDDESAHPADAPYGTVQFYVKGGLLIARFDDGGTIRYKYLNMAGTGVAWVHTTSAP